MKKSTKIISFCSIILAIIGLITCGLIIFVTQNNKQKNKSNEITNYATNNYDFFNNNKIDNGNQIRLENNFDKTLIVYQLTNYLDSFDMQKIKFSNNNIKQNLLQLTTNAIKTNKAFQRIENFYINIKYEVTYTSMILDIRWASKIDILNNQKTALYWDQLKMDI